MCEDETARPKRTISAAGRRGIAAAQRARWPANALPMQMRSLPRADAGSFLIRVPFQVLLKAAGAAPIPRRYEAPKPANLGPFSISGRLLQM